MNNEINWNPAFNIGVEIVDKAHQRLFSIVRRMLKLIRENEIDQWTCIEGLKYFKNYTAHHFMEEEAYMRSIGYVGYDMHKRLHDNMKNITLPALEEKMKASNYSMESVEQFLGICISWLTGHIMIEDRAITGKVHSKWDYSQLEEYNEILGKSLVDVMYKFFGLNSRMFSDHYGGEKFGKTINFCLLYAGHDKKFIRVIVSLEEKLILSSVQSLLVTEQPHLDTATLTATQELMPQLLHAIGKQVKLGDGLYQLQKNSLVSDDFVAKIFATRNPKYSLLIDTDAGYLALCIDEVRKKA